MITDLLASAVAGALRLARRPLAPPTESGTERAWRTVAIETWAQLGDIDGQLDAARTVLHAGGHTTTTDLARDVDNAIDRERQRIEQATADIAVAAGFDPTDAHRYDLPTVVAFVSRLRGERDGLVHPSGPRVCQLHDVAEVLSDADREPVRTFVRWPEERDDPTAASDVHAGAVCGVGYHPQGPDGPLHLCTEPPRHTTGGCWNDVPLSKET